ncbi:MAG TPA: XRE family transcriptional regulator [Pseudonocardiaceae bacterium]|nr:XRE family transcriptional regulator [Pseudonocardiaceae bacterium]
MSATNGSGRRESVASVGAQLRDRRLEVGLSLRQFARDLGVSPSFISQIENGKSQPSVATLYMICNALDLSIDELFNQSAPVEAVAVQPPVVAPVATGVSRRRTETFHGALAKLNDRTPDQENPVVTPAQRRRLVLDSGVTWEQLSSTHEAAVDFLFVRYDVGGSSVPDDKLTRHGGIEYGYVISGNLEITLGFDTYQVNAGESISFDSATPHRLTNRGDVPVEAIWFVHGRNPNHEH